MNHDKVSPVGFRTFRIDFFVELVEGPVPDPEGFGTHGRPLTTPGSPPTATATPPLTLKEVNPRKPKDSAKWSKVAANRYGDTLKQLANKARYARMFSTIPHYF